jgi:hypothetical protein
MKAKAKFFKGIEYVVATELPEDQQLLLEHGGNLEYIKILVDGKVISNCLSYSVYSSWYHSVFFVQRAAAPKPAPQKVYSTSVQLSKA